MSKGKNDMDGVLFRTSRLKTLSAHLRARVGAGSLSMESWVSWSPRQRPPGSIEELEGCGYAACAMGHACLIPEFREAGLTIDRHTGVPVFEGVHGILAAERFFSVSSFDASWLFTAGRYAGRPGPSEVADRIDRLVAALAEGAP